MYSVHIVGAYTPRYLGTGEATAMDGLNSRTLEYYRTVVSGLVYFNLGGRVRYSVAEIERWVRARRRYCTREWVGAMLAETARESVEAA